jgi:hypothetical protein
MLERLGQSTRRTLALRRILFACNKVGRHRACWEGIACVLRSWTCASRPTMKKMPPQQGRIATTLRYEWNRHDTFLILSDLSGRSDAIPRRLACCPKRSRLSRTALNDFLQADRGRRRAYAYGCCYWRALVVVDLSLCAANSLSSTPLTASRTICSKEAANARMRCGSSAWARSN